MTTTSKSLRGGAAASYQSLRVWKKAVDLVTECYQRTAGFPITERFGLTLQIRRAAVSVVSNIAEGHGRSSWREFRHYLKISRGSVKEIEAQFLIAERLGFATEEQLFAVRELCDAVSRMLLALRRSLESATERRTSRVPSGSAHTTARKNSSQSRTP